MQHALALLLKAKNSTLIFNNMITTILIISTLALIIFAITADFSWSSVLAPSRNELVFSWRNKEYGAYQLRRENHKSLLIALMLSVGLSAGLAIAFSGNNSISALPEIVEEKIFIRSIDPLLIPEQRKNIEQKNAVAPPPETSNNLPPEIVDPSEADLQQEADIGDENPDPSPRNGPAGLPGGVLGGKGMGLPSPDSAKSDIDFPDTMPQYPGGEKALLAYLGSSVNYSSLEIENGVRGTVWITFVVSKNGNVYDVVLERGILNGQRLEKEALKAVQRMPQWKPGLKKGKPVNVLYRAPFRFELRHS